MSTDQETDAAAGFGGELKSFGFRQAGIIHFGDDGADAAFAQGLFRSPESVITASCASQDQPAMPEAELRQTWSEEISPWGHP